MLIRVALRTTPTTTKASHTNLAELFREKRNLLYHAIQQQTHFTFYNFEIVFEENTYLVCITAKPTNATPKVCIDHCVYMVNCFIYIWLQSQFSAEYVANCAQIRDPQVKKSDIIQLSISESIWDSQQNKQALLPTSQYL